MTDKNKEYEKGYKKYESKANVYFEDKDKAEDLLKNAMKKANDTKGTLEDVWEKLQLLFEIIRAWIKGEYKEIPKGSIIMIIAAILYFVSPIDIIPDWILGIGLIDDVAVIAFVYKQVSSDLEKFKIWKENYC